MQRRREESRDNGAEQNPAERRLFVVLVAPRNPLNIGAAARAMSNFGYGNLRVVNPYELAFREARSAVCASTLLKDAKEYKSVAEAVADCALVVGTTAVRNRKLDHELRPLHEAALLIRKKLQSGSVALLFGSEKRGLSNEDLSYCRWLIRIPTVAEHPSMNLGQAVAVCLHELVRETGTSVQAEKEPAATAADLDRLTATLLDALHTSGYLKPTAAGPTEERIRRLVRRLNLTEDDAEIWLGILRQMLWKMRSRD
jgi:TrmH family RNA methyltransferase